MHQAPVPEGHPRQLISDAADNQLDSAGWLKASELWRHDADARHAWHAYHLIGDVLRSDELAGCGRDTAFLHRLRERLADEPAVLAPFPPSPAPVAASRTRLAWLAPAAVAAGFMAVAAVLLVARLADSEAMAPGAVISLAPRGLQPGTQQQPPAAWSVGHSSALGAVSVKAEDGMVLLRDAQLDRYLRAHRSQGHALVAQPGGVMRGAEVVVFER